MDKVQLFERWKCTKQNSQCNFKADLWHHLQPCTIRGKTDDWIFLKLLEKILKARDCNQSKRKKEVAQQLTAVNIFSLPNWKALGKYHDGFWMAITWSYSVARGVGQETEHFPVAQQSHRADINQLQETASAWEQNDPSSSSLCGVLCKISVSHFSSGLKSSVQTQSKTLWRIRVLATVSEHQLSPAHIIQVKFHCASHYSCKYVPFLKQPSWLQTVYNNMDTLLVMLMAVSDWLLLCFLLSTFCP